MTASTTVAHHRAAKTRVTRRTTASQPPRRHPRKDSTAWFTTAPTVSGPPRGSVPPRPVPAGARQRPGCSRWP
jgi:hypothetical protein